MRSVSVANHEGPQSPLIDRLSVCERGLTRLYGIAQRTGSSDCEITLESTNSSLREPDCERDEAIRKV